MVREGPYANQTTSAQNAAASGAANASPLAKLRFPLLRAVMASELSGTSFMVTHQSFGAGPCKPPTTRSCANAVRTGLFHRLGPGNGTAGHSAITYPSLPLYAGEFLAVLAHVAAGNRDRESSMAASPVIRVRPRPGQSRPRRYARRAAVFLTILCLSRPSYGQDARIVTPMEIFDPERGDGVTLGGSFTALPFVDADAVYNSNIYNVADGEIDDIVFSLRPTLVVRTNLPRHEFSLRGSSEVRRHLETESENSEQFEAAGRARLDLASRTELSAEAGFRHLIERRGTAGDFFLTDEPVEFDQKFASVRLQRVGGFVEMTGEAQVAEFDYNDATLNGVEIDLSGRDASVRRARIRGSAPTGRNTRVFAEIGGNQVRYERNPATRNSSGYSLLAGMQVNLTDLLSLEAAGGYLRQNFKDPFVKSVGGLNFHLRGEWTPAPTWQISASADRLVDPSPRDAIPAIVRSSFRLGARKALSDRLLVSADAAVVDDDYRSTTLSERRFEVGTRAHYRLTRNVGVIGRLSYRDQNGKGGGRDYDGFTVGLGLRMAL